MACHQGDGSGIKGAFPPLAKSDYLKNDTKKVVNVLKNGLTGPVTVNGDRYNGVMPSLGLSNEEIANVLTFIYSSWGNSGKTITTEDVNSIH